ncbi:TetR/AcrR family transcriptional regulator C-terminal domain-containing protein [Amycolatopsis decaplanina]|uniref:TetR family transcriptional regulator n=1 Tax=Amycolatopsis decaplanina DSM 44594 TaxID=1284240 RepID=M2YTT6_9PSEU|nr:TetR/AcrR family transcriptional regulator C-terminal domain-containing protein [Amycolatopsis decaplanina]EME52123.1 TetR family transcriptional regulator [Amycolatopsis decaplanina DSM 44594]
MSRPRRRAEKPVLSQDLVVKTALDLLAAEGLEAVSMRRVAQALETGPASLYAHVANKEELHELMVDHVLDFGPFPEPDPRRWVEQAKDLLRENVRALTSFPGIAKIAWTIPVPVGANALQQAEAMLAVLRAGGLDLKRALFAADALWLYAKAFAYEGAGWQHGDINLAEQEERGRRMVEYMTSFPPGAFPNLLGAREYFTAETAQERFEFAIDLFLRGLASTTS